MLRASNLFVQGVGLTAIMAAKLTSPKHLIVVDMVQAKLDLATKYGASHVLNGNKDDIEQRILEITGERGVDFALDCVGNPAILSLGQKCLVPRGTLVTVGGLGGKLVQLDGTSVIQKGLTYRACHQGDAVPHTVRYFGAGRTNSS